MKECIACAELIQSEAKLCKHCGILQDDERYSRPSPQIAKLVEEDELVRSLPVSEPQTEAPHSQETLAFPVDKSIDNDKITEVNKSKKPGRVAAISIILFLLAAAGIGVYQSSQPVDRWAGVNWEDQTGKVAQGTVWHPTLMNIKGCFYDGICPDPGDQGTYQGLVIQPVAARDAQSMVSTLVEEGVCVNPKESGRDNDPSWNCEREGGYIEVATDAFSTILVVDLPTEYGLIAGEGWTAYTIDVSQGVQQSIARVLGGEQLKLGR